MRAQQQGSVVQVIHSRLQQGSVLFVSLGPSSVPSALAVLCTVLLWRFHLLRPALPLFLALPFSGDSIYCRFPLVCPEVLACNPQSRNMRAQQQGSVVQVIHSRLQQGSVLFVSLGPSSVPGTLAVLCTVFLWRFHPLRPALPLFLALLCSGDSIFCLFPLVCPEAALFGMKLVGHP